MTQDPKPKLEAVDPRPARQDESPRRAPPPAPGDDEPTLGDYVAILSDGRWLVLGAVVAALVLAVAYVLVATPRYRADILVQVEDKSAGPGGLEDLSLMLGGKTPAETEIEIIRSRYLVGSVVDQLALDVVARPRTVPLIGGALFRRWDEEGLRGPVLGLGRFAWGGERIQVGQLDVPPRLLGEPLTLVAGEGGKYELLGPQGERLLEGSVGALAVRPSTGSGRTDGDVRLFVTELVARPGTELRLSRLRRPAVVEDLQEDLRISEKGKKTGVIQVALEGSDPARIASTLDAVASTYLRQNVERKSAEAQKTLAFLEQQLPSLRASVDAAELALERYQQQHGSVNVSLETKAAIDRAVDVEKGLSELQVQLAELRQKFTDSHPAVATLRQKTAELEGEKARLEGRMKLLPTAELDSARLIRDGKVATELYVLLLNKAQELRVVKEGTIGNVRILDTAVIPAEPVAPRKAATLALALVLGLAGGVALAFTRRALSHGVEDPDVVERETGLGVYATVPQSDREEALAIEAARRKRGGAILASAEAHDLAVESIRSLRTSLQFALAGAPNNVVAVLGPAPSVGKSFVALNLAHVVAEAGLRVALVDGDLRKGRLHRHFGVERDHGLSEAIAGTLPLAEALRRTESANLSFLATGRTPPNPAELLASERFGKLLRELSASHDLVVVDTPPVLAVTDAAIVARHAGVNLLVLRAGKHPVREILAAVKRVEQGGALIHGAVMNDVSAGMGYRKYYYYYGYEKPKA